MVNSFLLTDAEKSYVRFSAKLPLTPATPYAWSFSPTNCGVKPAPYISVYEKVLLSRTNPPAGQVALPVGQWVR